MCWGNLEKTEQLGGSQRNTVLWLLGAGVPARFVEPVPLYAARPVYSARLTCVLSACVISHAAHRRIIRSWQH